MDYDNKEQGCTPQAADGRLGSVNVGTPSLPDLRNTLRKAREEQVYKETAGIPAGSGDVISQAYRELNSQCSAAPLIDIARQRARDAVFSAPRTQRATRYLDLAAKHPEVAEMIELARNL